MTEINKFIDYTLLTATATDDEIVQLCQEANENNFFAVCINSCNVSLAKKHLKGSEIKICSVIGFPLGAMSSEAKVFEASQAIKDGASEIDMVINIGFLRSGKFEAVEEEIRSVKKVIGNNVLKVIIETCYLTSGEIQSAAAIVVKAGGDFVKTSTGFGSGGASSEAIELIKNSVGDKAKIKASGGIKNLETALRYIEAGVKRIGTSSGVSIVKEVKK